MLSILAKIHDQATQQAKEVMARSAKEHSRATVSAGYELRQSVKAGMQREAPGGEAWPAPSSWIQYGGSLLGRARSAQRRAQGRKRAPRKPPPRLFGTKGRKPLGRLAGAVRLQKSAGGDTTRVRVGFLTDKVARLAAYHAEDHTVPVTAKMRRLIFAVGLGIRKTSLFIPRRRHVEPVLEKNRALIPQFLRARVNAAAAGIDPRSVSARFF